jgi:hypothetical protein
MQPLHTKACSCCAPWSPTAELVSGHSTVASPQAVSSRLLDTPVQTPPLCCCWVPGMQPGEKGTCWPCRVVRDTWGSANGTRMYQTVPVHSEWVGFGQTPLAEGSGCLMSEADPIITCAVRNHRARMLRSAALMTQKTSLTSPCLASSHAPPMPNAAAVQPPPGSTRAWESVLSRHKSAASSMIA